MYVRKISNILELDSKFVSSYADAGDVGITLISMTVQQEEPFDMSTKNYEHSIQTKRICSRKDFSKIFFLQLTKILNEVSRLKYYRYTQILLFAKKSRHLWRSLKSYKPRKP